MHRRGLEEPGEGSISGSPKTGLAAEGAGLREYFARKRSVCLWSALSILVTAALLARWSSFEAVALATGGACGIANALLSMRANERLLDHRSVALFAFSSILRILVFGIVPVEFALHGPWWSMGIYFTGFFTPLALFAVSVGRASRTE